MQQQVGYELVDIQTSAIIQKWGGLWGQCPGEPETIVLPNGDIVCGMRQGETVNGYRLDPWMMDGPPVPQQVPMWAVRTVLQNEGRFDEINTIIAGSTDRALKNVWEYGNFADRNSTAINTIAYTLGLTEQQVDQMFFDANSLEV